MADMGTNDMSAINIVPAKALSKHKKTSARKKVN